MLASGAVWTDVVVYARYCVEWVWCANDGGGRRFVTEIAESTSNSRPRYTTAFLACTHFPRRPDLEVALRFVDVGGGGLMSVGGWAGCC